ncbi:uncharacterized protein LOC102671149 [Apis dorsata]|uniref:uncharacterized protein LOC102671149 n=1 Tax=Apis dorsata TaxID=7462 RepID=UPI0012931CD1|nr:uncharacterized protein LOC102671149 [Apis dorsata]
MYNSPKYDLLSDKGKKIYNNIIDSGYLNPNKFRFWIQRILSKVLNKLPKVEDKYELIVNNQKIKIKIIESGPAYTIIINMPHETENIHIDLAPTLAFHINCINHFTSKFNELQNCRNETWFAIPLPLTDNDSNNKNLYWRLSFSYQEKEILAKYGRIKPVIRQIKKLRDTQNWKSIASYFIETLFLHKIEELKNDLEKIPFTLFLFKMLQELYYACDKHMLEFYWDKQYNLFSKISKIEMHNITYRLKNIISNIEKYSSDEFILAKFICKLCFLKLRNDDI